MTWDAADTCHEAALVLVLCLASVSSVVWPGRSSFFLARQNLFGDAARIALSLSGGRRRSGRGNHQAIYELYEGMSYGQPSILTRKKVGR